MRRLDNARVLMYSHDTFGLGHLRRCRTIAHALVNHYKGINVLIISGTPIVGAFDFLARVDFVKIPSVIKLYNGEYTSIDRHIDLEDTLAMRAAIIRQTAETFEPDILIVDKEPLGLRGELEDTLSYLKARGTTLVLGLREVMDSPILLKAEWGRSDMVRQVERLYDSIWVYGPEDFWDPLTGMAVPPSLRQRMTYTGFLHRTVQSGGPAHHRPVEKYVLVTTGGGGDGADLIRQVVAAYEHDPDIPFSSILVLGPFMPAHERDEIWARAARLRKINIIEFDSRLEVLLRDACAVIAMGGYNTFCEVLSFDKPALIVPRVRPREEQMIRARRAAELGAVTMLHPDAAADPATLARLMRALPDQPRPSQTRQPLKLDGLETISDLVGACLEARGRPLLSVVKG